MQFGSRARLSAPERLARVATLVTVALLASTTALSTAHANQAACDNPDALGVARTVEIDTTGGPGFGMDHYKAYDFLQDKEVVLTFDDGPQKFSTEAVLAALAKECTKATFFSVGKMALGYPFIVREVIAAGHTVGTHTWSHKTIAKLKTFEEGKDEIERGISAVRRAAGGPIAPFFRFPTLRDSKEALAHLATRNIAMFSTDIDSFDFKLQRPEVLAKSIISKLEKRGKGILLMHDIHRNTAKALPLLLAGLKEKGFKIVHLTAKGEVETLPEFDKAIEPDVKGLPQVGASKPVSSIVKTVEGTPPPAEAAAKEEAPPAPAAPAVPAAAPPPAAAPEVKPKAEVAPAPSVPAAVSAPGPVAAVDAGATARPANPVSDISAQRTSADDSGKPASETAAGDATSTAHSLSEKAQDMWRMWFGK